MLRILNEYSLVNPPESTSEASPIIASPELPSRKENKIYGVFTGTGFENISVNIVKNSVVKVFSDSFTCEQFAGERNVYCVGSDVNVGNTPKDKIIVHRLIPMSIVDEWFGNETEEFTALVNHIETLYDNELISGAEYDEITANLNTAAIRDGSFPFWILLGFGFVSPSRVLSIDGNNNEYLVVYATQYSSIEYPQSINTDTGSFAESEWAKEYRFYGGKWSQPNTTWSSKQFYPKRTTPQLDGVYYKDANGNPIFLQDGEQPLAMNNPHYLGNNKLYFTSYETDKWYWENGDTGTPSETEFIFNNEYAGSTTLPLSESTRIIPSAKATIPIILHGDVSESEDFVAISHNLFIELDCLYAQSGTTITLPTPIILDKNRDYSIDNYERYQTKVFEGWFLDEDCTIPFDNIIGETVLGLHLYAKLTPTCKITIDLTAYSDHQEQQIDVSYKGVPVDRSANNYFKYQILIKNGDTLKMSDISVRLYAYAYRDRRRLRDVASWQNTTTSYKYSKDEVVVVDSDIDIVPRSFFVKQKPRLRIDTGTPTSDETIYIKGFAPNGWSIYVDDDMKDIRSGIEITDGSDICIYMVSYNKYTQPDELTIDISWLEIRKYTSDGSYDLDHFEDSDGNITTQFTTEVGSATTVYTSWKKEFSIKMNVMNGIVALCGSDKVTIPDYLPEVTLTARTANTIVYNGVSVSTSGTKISQEDIFDNNGDISIYTGNTTKKVYIYYPWQDYSYSTPLDADLIVLIESYFYRYCGFDTSVFSPDAKTIIVNDNVDIGDATFDRFNIEKQRVRPGMSASLKSQYTLNHTFDMYVSGNSSVNSLSPLMSGDDYLPKVDAEVTYQIVDSKGYVDHDYMFLKNRTYNFSGRSGIHVVGRTTSSGYHDILDPTSSSVLITKSVIEGCNLNRTAANNHLRSDGYTFAVSSYDYYIEPDVLRSIRTDVKNSISGTTLPENAIPETVDTTYLCSYYGYYNTVHLQNGNIIDIDSSTPQRYSTRHKNTNPRATGNPKVYFIIPPVTENSTYP